MNEATRRSFLKGAAALGAGAGLMTINPEYFLSPAAAQEGKTLVFLSAENITGNWDPTAHTTLSQKNIEGFVMGFLTRTPMRVDNPDEVVYELATGLTLLDRRGVVFDPLRFAWKESNDTDVNYMVLASRPKA